MTEALNLITGPARDRTAIFSPCTIHGGFRGDFRGDCKEPECVGRLYRYELTRRWGAGLSLAIFGLNPSTAGAEDDDATIAREVRLARREGFAGLIKGNVFALRAKDPKWLWQDNDPVGPENDAYIEKIARRAGRIVVAWGANARAQARARRVAELLAGIGPLFCLGQTDKGYPRHPLDRSGAVTRNTKLVPFDISKLRSKSA